MGIERRFERRTVALMGNVIVDCGMGCLEPAFYPSAPKCALQAVLYFGNAEQSRKLHGEPHSEVKLVTSPDQVTRAERPH